MEHIDMQQSAVPKTLCRSRSTACWRTLLAVGSLSAVFLLAGCSCGGIYANIGIAEPSVDLGPVSIQTGVNLGRWL